MSDTLAAPAGFALEVKKSRFVVHAAPSESAAVALEFITTASDPDATHNCWAWRVGAQYRFNDDGEPAGTAGRPILAAIDGQGFDQVAVLVVRWFGGIKLGAGGLVRAYGGAAAECLRRAPRRALVEQATARLHCAFEYAATVHGLLGQFAAVKLAERYDVDGVILTLRLPAANGASFSDTLRDLTRGQARLELENA